MTDTRLFRLRVGRKVTQGQVAVAVGVTQSYYSKVEKESVIPSPEIAAQIALFFGHEITEMQLLFPSRYPLEAAV